ncbi:hypothetical protein Glove_818134g2 [Diversispora epigaea]|uniref:Protein kinase domain-containing protein n=1 Tax=Diversispora epigaea TaxID=1348612 RepID=A0A397G1R2_9GLOM|nr:hypothetical protein Glove_818134g2 [Diversispora epigaea]
MSQRRTINNSNNDILFYHYSRFENVKIINKKVCKANIKKTISQQKKTVEKVVALKCITLNNKFTLNNFINEVKRHRKLEINNSILKFYGITKQENVNNYMIVLEYVNNGTLRQYLKTNFQKLDWNVKLNLSKQIANALMNLHLNNIIHGKLTTESILVHNGTIKLNDFGINYLKSLFTTVTIPIQYTDFRYLELFNNSLDIYSLGIILWEISCDGIFPFEKELITKSSLALSSTDNNIIDLINDIISKGKSEKCIPEIPPKYKEIYTDCLKHHGNSRPDIFEVVNDLTKINIISDINLTNNLENSDEEKVQSNSPFIDFITTKANNFNIIFFKKLFEFFINLFQTQFQKIRPIMINNYIREHNLNSVKLLHKMIRYPSNYWFTSLIGFFYKHGIGTVIDDKMAFKFFSLAADERIFMKNVSLNLSLRKFYNINKEIGILNLANMYRNGIGVEKDLKKGFQIYSKAAGEGSHIALCCTAFCYSNGFGVEKNKEKAFELYLKSAEKGNLGAQCNVGYCCENGIGIAKDETIGFRWFIKPALAGNIDSIFKIGYYYANGIGVGVDEKEAFNWYFKGAEKGHSIAQHNLGIRYKYGYGTNQDQEKAFKWYKKAAENDYSNSQYNLGECFYEGHGIGKDLIKAIYWLNKAKENENMAASELLEEIIDRIIFF